MQITDKIEISATLWRVFFLALLMWFLVTPILRDIYLGTQIVVLVIRITILLTATVAAWCLVSVLLKRQREKMTYSGTALLFLPAALLAGLATVLPQTTSEYGLMLYLGKLFFGVSRPRSGRFIPHTFVKCAWLLVTAAAMIILLWTELRLPCFRCFGKP